MSLLQVRLWQLSKLLPPRLAAHLESHAVLPVLYASSWLLTCFAADFPLHFAGRVMDVLLTGHQVASPVLKVGAGGLGTGSGQVWGGLAGDGAGGRWQPTARRTGLCIPFLLRPDMLRGRMGLLGVHSLLLQSAADDARPGPWPARPPLAAQVAVALVQRCEADLLRVTDFEEMVRRAAPSTL